MAEATSPSQASVTPVPDAKEESTDTNAEPEIDLTATGADGDDDDDDDVIVESGDEDQELGESSKVEDDKKTEQAMDTCNDDVVVVENGDGNQEVGGADAEEEKAEVDVGDKTEQPMDTGDDPSSRVTSPQHPQVLTRQKLFSTLESHIAAARTKMVATCPVTIDDLAGPVLRPLLDKCDQSFYESNWWQMQNGISGQVHLHFKTEQEAIEALESLETLKDDIEVFHWTATSEPPDWLSTKISDRVFTELSHRMKILGGLTPSVKESDIAAVFPGARITIPIPAHLERHGIACLEYPTVKAKFDAVQDRELMVGDCPCLLTDCLTPSGRPMRDDVVALNVQSLVDARAKLAARSSTMILPEIVNVVRQIRRVQATLSYDEDLKKLYNLSNPLAWKKQLKDQLDQKNSELTDSNQKKILQYNVQQLESWLIPKGGSAEKKRNRQRANRKRRASTGQDSGEASKRPRNQLESSNRGNNKNMPAPNARGPAGQPRQKRGSQQGAKTAGQQQRGAGQQQRGAGQQQRAGGQQQRAGGQQQRAGGQQQRAGGQQQRAGGQQQKAGGQQQRGAGQQQRGGGQQQRAGGQQQRAGGQQQRAGGQQQRAGGQKQRAGGQQQRAGGQQQRGAGQQQRGAGQQQNASQQRAKGQTPMGTKKGDQNRGQQQQRSATSPRGRNQPGGNRRNIQEGQKRKQKSIRQLQRQANWQRERSRPQNDLSRYGGQRDHRRTYSDAALDSHREQWYGNDTAQPLMEKPRPLVAPDPTPTPLMQPDPSANQATALNLLVGLSQILGKKRSDDQPVMNLPGESMSGFQQPAAQLMPDSTRFLGSYQSGSQMGVSQGLQQQYLGTQQSSVAALYPDVHSSSHRESDSRGGYQESRSSNRRERDGKSDYRSSDSRSGYQDVRSSDYRSSGYQDVLGSTYRSTDSSSGYKVSDLTTSPWYSSGTGNRELGGIDSSAYQDLGGSSYRASDAYKRSTSTYADDDPYRSGEYGGSGYRRY